MSKVVVQNENIMLTRTSDLPVSVCGTAYLLSVSGISRRSSCKAFILTGNEELGAIVEVVRRFDGLTDKDTHGGWC